MISIRKFKEWAEPFLRRISPILFRELLRFMRVYHFFCRGNKKKELVSLRVQERVGVRHLYNVYANPKGTLRSRIIRRVHRYLYLSPLCNWSCIQKFISPKYPSGSYHDTV